MSGLFAYDRPYAAFPEGATPKPTSPSPLDKRDPRDPRIRPFDREGTKNRLTVEERLVLGLPPKRPADIIKSWEEFKQLPWPRPLVIPQLSAQANAFSPSGEAGGEGARPPRTIVNFLQWECSSCNFVNPKAKKICFKCKEVRAQ